jgi:hypothetical protein
MCDPGASTYKTREAHAKECVDMNAPFAPKRKTQCKEVRIEMQSRLPFGKAISFPGDSPAATDEQGCDTTGATEYFPVKAAPQHSRTWDVEYRKWYKVATYTLDGKTHRYVLTRKGCPTPDVTADAFITLPVSSAGFSSSTYHTYMEMMGSRATLKAMNGEYATTPCLNQMLLDNKTVDYNKHPTVLSTLDVFFSDKWTSLDSLGGTIDAKRFVTVGPEAERDLLPQLEWLEFFSLFFDKEATVQSYVQDTEAAMLCLTSKLLLNAANNTQNGGGKVRVLWATPDEKGDWSVGTCPSYYCEAIESAGGTVLNKRASVMALKPASTSSLFAAGVAGDADVILVAPSYNSATYAPLTSAECKPIYDAIPAQVPAVAKKNIWDYGKGRVGPDGGLDWFGSRLAEPDALVEEMADIFYPALKVKGSIPKFWWQNVYTELMCDPGASTYKTREAHAKECVDVNAPFAPKRSSSCEVAKPASLVITVKPTLVGSLATQSVPSKAPATSDGTGAKVRHSFGFSCAW